MKYVDTRNFQYLGFNTQKWKMNKTQYNILLGLKKFYIHICLMIINASIELKSIRSAVKFD